MKRLCAALLCLLVTAGLWGCGERAAEDSPEDSFEEEVFTQPITKIDLSAPESQKYRDWLDKFYANPYSEEPVPEQTVVEPPSTIPKSNRPNIKASKKDNSWYEMLSQSIEEGFSSEGAAEENWKTWGWNDDWELEVYEYKKNYLGWEVLRARNKTTDETRFIHEVFNDASGDNGWSSFKIAQIDDLYIVYCIDDWMVSPRYFFFALGQEKPCFIGHEGSSGYLDEKHTTLWYRHYDENTKPRRSLRFVDLQKMAAGEKDAERIMLGSDEGWSYDRVWTTERVRYSTVYIHVVQVTNIPIDVLAWRCEYGPEYIWAYDPVSDVAVELLELPFIEEKCGYLSRPIDESGTYYYYDWNQAYPYFKDGKETDLSTIDFYVINLNT